MPKRETAEPVIVLIDGECNLCHSIVRFIVERDSGGTFRFAALQSERGRSLLKRGGLADKGLDSVVVVDGSRYYAKSAAALRIFRILGWPWKALYGLRLFPPFVRNLAYDWVAGRRYRWFGRHDGCLLPTPAVRARFLPESSTDEH